MGWRTAIVLAALFCLAVLFVGVMPWAIAWRDSHA